MNLCTLPTCLCAALVSFSPTGALAQTRYAFTNIADDTGAFTRFEAPVLNSHGIVAFRADLDSGRSGIFTGSGGPITTIADSNGPYFNFGTLPSINDSGTVAFFAWGGASGRGVYTSHGAVITTIAESSEEFFHFEPPEISASGTVAFRGFYHFGTAILTGDGGPLTTIADSAGPPFHSVLVPSLNNLGRVVFYGMLDDGAEGIFTGGSGVTTTIADTHGPFSSLLGYPSIDDSGTVAFFAKLDAGGNGIFTGNGGPIKTIADTSGPFEDFIHTSINDSGTVAFVARLDGGGIGIFTGNDLVVDKVIRSGDPLLGSTVITLNFIRGLADNGDVAFRYTLANGATGIAIARVVPEPESLSLFGLGTFAFRRRRYART